MKPVNLSPTKLIIVLNTIFGLIVAVSGLVVVIGWLQNLSFLKSFGLGYVTLKANLAAGFLISGLTLILLQYSNNTLRIICRLLSFLVSLIGILTSAEIILKIDFGIDNLLFHSLSVDSISPEPIRMALNAALSLIFIGFSEYALSFEKVKATFFNEFCVVFPFSVSLLGLIAFFLDLAEFSQYTGFFNMAILATILFILLCIGLFLTFFRERKFIIPIEQQFFAGLVFIALILVFITLLSHSCLKRIWKTSNKVEQTQIVNSYLSILLTDVVDVETGVSGYLISKEDTYLESMVKAQRDIPVTMGTLRNLIKENPNQAMRLDTLESLINERVLFAEKLKSTLKYEGEAKGIELFSTNKGKYLTDQIRVLIDLMKNEEDKLLSISNRTELRFSVKAQSIIYLNLSIQIILLVVIFFIIKRNILHRRKAIADLHTLNNELEKRVLERTASLAKSEERYRNIFENIQDVYYRINKDGIITEISPSIKRLSGYTSREVIGKPSTIFYYFPEERKLLLEKLAHKSEVWDYEVRMRTKDGIIKYTSLNAHLIFDEKNEPTDIEGSFRDIDERKHVELKLEEAKVKAEESDRLKTAFLHNISHEIRTPMNAIIGFSSILGEDEAISETQKSFIQSIQEGSTQLLSIINDIVDISSIEANVLKKYISSVNINETLEILYNQFKLKASENNNSINVTPCLEKGNVILDTDKTKLIQILSNLISNALKFTQNGKIEFGYNLKENIIEFFVSDTGIGIAQDQHKRIFEHFYQVENDFSRQYGGTGLGLAISKAYTEFLGGKIWLQSEPCKGSTFYFNIPYISSQSGVLWKKEIREFKDFRFLHPVIILVAEDDDQNFNLIFHHLSDPNVELVRAINGYEAVELCKSHNFDIILMDLKMPVMDGYTATEEIKKHYPHLPVIAQTAFVTDKEKAKTYGCDDFLSKPFNKEEIISIIHKHLKIKTQ